MNIFLVHCSRHPMVLLQSTFSIHKICRNAILLPQYFATTIDAIDAFTMELMHKPKNRRLTKPLLHNSSSVTYFTKTDKPDILDKNVSDMTVDELDSKAEEHMKRNRDKQLSDLVEKILETHQSLSNAMWKKLLKAYSYNGKPEMVEHLQKCCSKADPYLYKRNGEFMHYLAKAQCMKGNSEKGLEILKEGYKRHVNLRVFYRSIFKELIQDSVLNRSEASLVVFRKYVLEFSDKWGDHYPLICLWHLCWSSTWFSDQMLSNELLESSTCLQDIIKDKATALCINMLKQDYNEDAVVRLLQALLKYQMMDEYVNVLQILFSYKLMNRDFRGCTEILKNCEALGVKLSSDVQARYIRLIINSKNIDKQPSAKAAPSKNFKFKF